MAELVDVEQCDRDAAGKLIGNIGLSWMGDMIRTGKSDEHDYVQAFARHRLTALRANTVRPEGVGREKLIADVAGLIEDSPCTESDPDKFGALNLWGNEATAVVDYFLALLSTSDDTPAAVDRDMVMVPREATEAMLSAVCSEPTHLYGKEGRGGEYEAGMKVATTVARMTVASQYRQMIEAALPTSGSTPDAESHACTNGVAEAQPADHLAQAPDAVAGDELAERYNELLYAVAKKFPGEDRHQTALRYIRERESVSDDQAAARLRGEGK